MSPKEEFEQNRFVYKELEVLERLCALILWIVPHQPSLGSSAP